MRPHAQGLGPDATLVSLFVGAATGSYEPGGFTWVDRSLPRQVTFAEKQTAFAGEFALGTMVRPRLALLVGFTGVWPN